jgi:hypothetical protein
MHAEVGKWSETGNFKVNSKAIIWKCMKSMENEG